MPDPFRKVEPGEEIAIGAVAWNAMQGAGKEFQRRQTDRLADPITTARSSTIITVKNDTNVHMDRNWVLGLDGPIFSPGDSSLNTFMREVTFRGINPTDASHKRRYCVTLEPAVPRRIVRAYLSGICQVKVDIIDPSHGYAIIDDQNMENMKSSRHGHARILWSEGEEGYGYGYGYSTGIQWCIVFLGAESSCDAIGKAEGTISGRVGTTYGIGSVGLFISDGGYGADGPVEVVPVLNPGTVISTGKYVAVSWDSDDVAWVAPLECE